MNVVSFSIITKCWMCMKSMFIQNTLSAKAVQPHSFSAECFFEVSQPHSWNTQNSFWASQIFVHLTMSIICISFNRKLNSALNDITIIRDDEWGSEWVLKVPIIRITSKTLLDWIFLRTGENWGLFSVLHFEIFGQKCFQMCIL